LDSPAGEVVYGVWQGLGMIGSQGWRDRYPGFLAEEKQSVKPASGVRGLHFQRDEEDL
jgi:hypothetical protein